MNTLCNGEEASTVPQMLPGWLVEGTKARCSQCTHCHHCWGGKKSTVHTVPYSMFFNFNMFVQSNSNILSNYVKRSPGHTGRKKRSFSDSHRLDLLAMLPGWNSAYSWHEFLPTLAVTSDFNFSTAAASSDFCLAKACSLVQRSGDWINCRPLGFDTKPGPPVSRPSIRTLCSVEVGGHRY